MNEVGVRLKVAASGLENIQALTKELNGAGVETTALDSKAAELGAELKRLGAEQALIDSFKRQASATAAAAAAMEAAKTDAHQLAQELAATVAPANEQAQALSKADAAALAADQAYRAQKLALQQLASQMATAGVATNDLGAAQQRIHQGLVAAEAAIRSTALATEGLSTAELSLGRNGQGVQQNTQALATALRTLQQQLGSAATSADTMGQHLDTAFRTLGVRSVADVTAEVNRLRAALVTVKAADAFGPDVERAAAAMQARVHALDVELGRVPATAAAAQTGLRGVATASTSAATTMEAAAGKAIAMGTALLGIAGAGQAVQGVLGTAAAFETLRVRLEQVLGGTKAAEEAFDRIKKLAISTPFEVKDLTDTFIRLTNFGLKPTQTQMMALADTAAVAGGGTEALSRVTLALGQAWAKTKLQGDEILQLTEAGVPVWDLLAKATGKNVVELQHLSETGALGRDVILKLFDAMGEKNVGASAKLMGTFAGTISNAKDAMAEFFDMIGRSGALDYLTKKLQEALDEFDAMKNSGELERKAKAIADAFINFAQGVELAIKAVHKIIGVLELLAAAWAAEKVLAFSKALLGVQVASKAAAVGITGLAAAQTAGAATAATAAVAVQAVGVRATVAAVGVGLLGRAMALLTPLAIGAVVIGLVELVAGFFRAKKAAEDADKAVAKMLAGPPPSEQTARAALHDVASELADFKKNLPKLEGDIAALTGEGLANVAKSTIENLRAIKAEGVDMGKAILVISERAAQSLGIELPTQAAKASNSFKGVKAEVDTLIGQLPNLGLSAKAAGDVVSQALSKLVDAAKTKRDFELVEQSIKLMGDTGRISIGAVAALMRDAKDRAKELRDQVEANTPGMQSLGEAAKKAGIDVGLLTTGITKGGRDNIQVLHDLVDEVIKSGVAAARASPVLAEAFDKRIAAAQTAEEVKKITAELERARDSGKLFGSDLTTAVEKARLKLLELSPAIRAAMADAALLGVTLKDKIGVGADAGVAQGLAAYERLKGGGKASAAELELAFKNVAEQAIKAANGQIPEWVKVEAALRGVRLESLAGVKVLGQVVAGMNEVSAATQKAEDSALRYGSALKALKYDADKFALGADGSRFSTGGGADDPLLAKQQAADVQSKFNAAMAAYAVALDKVQNYGNYFLVTGVDPTTTSARQQALAEQAQAAFLGVQVAQRDLDALKTNSSAKPAAVNIAAAATSAAANTSHTVTINLPSGASRTVNMASANDANALSNLLAALEADMKRANP